MNEQNSQKKMIEEARELWLRYGGREHRRIEREMRERGWPFSRGVLYTKRHSHGVTGAWPLKFGWVEQLSTEQRARLHKSNANRNTFESWLRETSPTMTWTWRYQRYLYERLARVTGGRARRLMIFMPPRHGKSEMVTIRYTAWRLLQNPKLNVILASYNQKLADKFSRRVKRIVRAFEANVGGAAYSLSSSAPATEKRSFSARRRGEPREGLLNSVSEWETRGGGVVRSVGVGAGIAGFGAGLIVIDDPVKNRAEAESETYRERVWEWFNDDIYTRMEPNAAIVLIQTRWHEDDLAGRLLREINEGGEKWDIVSLPALAEADAMQNAECKMQNGDPLGRSPGEALCPTRFPVKVLERYRRKLGSYSFASLYQQSPAPAEGGQFKRSWFAKVVDEAPAGLIWKRGYDLAVSTKTTADYTASFRCAYDKNGNLYIADGFRARIEYPEQRRYIAERMRRENGTEHGIESAMHGKAVVQELRRDVGLRRYPLREVRVAGDKLTRALTWLNLAEAGKVILVRGPWMDEFVDEIARFPTGKHDDQIDAVSIAVSMLTRRGGGLHFFSPPRQ